LSFQSLAKLFQWRQLSEAEKLVFEDKARRINEDNAIRHAAEEAKANDERYSSADFGKAVQMGSIFLFKKKQLLVQLTFYKLQQINFCSGGHICIKKLYVDPTNFWSHFNCSQTVD
jgi:hypothetical protein